VSLIVQWRHLHGACMGLAVLAFALPGCDSDDKPSAERPSTSTREESSPAARPGAAAPKSARGRRAPGPASYRSWRHIRWRRPHNDRCDGRRSDWSEETRGATAPDRHADWPCAYPSAIGGVRWRSCRRGSDLGCRGGAQQRARARPRYRPRRGKPDRDTAAEPLQAQPWRSFASQAEGKGRLPERPDRGWRGLCLGGTATAGKRCCPPPNRSAQR
jgi:hypothetical protein